MLLMQINVTVIMLAFLFSYAHEMEWMFVPSKMRLRVVNAYALYITRLLELKAGEKLP